jgi:hypothetical protein
MRRVAPIASYARTAPAALHFAGYGVRPGDGRDVRPRGASASRLRLAGVGADGLAEEIRPELTNPLWPGPRTVILRSGAVASGVTWHVAAEMA